MRPQQQCARKGIRSVCHQKRIHSFQQFPSTQGSIHKAQPSPKATPHCRYFYSDNLLNNENYFPSKKLEDIMRTQPKGSKNKLQRLQSKLNSIIITPQSHNQLCSIPKQYNKHALTNLQTPFTYNKQKISDNSFKKGIKTLPNRQQFGIGFMNTCKINQQNMGSKLAERILEANMKLKPTNFLSSHVTPINQLVQIQRQMQGDNF